MKYFCCLGIALSFFAAPTRAQGLFDDKFPNCNSGEPCVYCGDTLAHYVKDLTNYMIYCIEHSYNNSRYESKSFDVVYELFVDSTGRTCVVSAKSLGLGWSWLMKDDVRKFLNNMADWKPAVKDHHAINSTVIVEAKFISNYLSVACVPMPKNKEKQKKRDD